MSKHPIPAEAIRLGAHRSGTGVTFALRSRHATAARVCLVSPTGTPQREQAMERQGDLWRTTVEGIGPGQLYGFRVDGPFAPRDGHRFDPSKLLVDPYARALCGGLEWGPSIGDRVDGAGPGSTGLDSAGSVPLSVVIDPTFDWQEDRRPATPWADSVIYEAHVRGLTQLHPEVPAELRGTYLGIAHEAVTEHLVALGVTAVELMPTQAFTSERHLVRSGLTNYWGYSPLGWLAPHAGYATGQRGEQVREFKAMVQALHRAGLEVILDVVYNHTVEGDESGPTLCLRGLDNATYYRSTPDDPGRLADFTGCGNTLDFSQAEVVDLAHDSLVYWAEEMHVDGFRFDLATVLGRDPVDFRSDGGLLGRLEEDPRLAEVKLIAEPWDLGPGGYALGRFPSRWREWNDRYRDGVRRFWRGEAGSGAELRQRVAGSPDLFPERGPSASINFVVAHDGFTLADLVSYETKRNWANGEHNRDGSDHEHSANWGVEGPTSVPEIMALRARLQRTFLATLALSPGVPMILLGSELGRTQGGNNNAYCQDNRVSWMRWDLGEAREALLRFTRRVMALRNELGIGHATAPGAITWLDATGEPLAVAAEELCFGRLSRHDRSNGVLVLFNATAEKRQVTLPRLRAGATWSILLDTAIDDGDPAGQAGTQTTIEPHSLRCLVAPLEDPLDPSAP